MHSSWMRGVHVNHKGTHILHECGHSARLMKLSELFHYLRVATLRETIAVVGATPIRRVPATMSLNTKRRSKVLSTPPVRRDARTL